MKCSVLYGRQRLLCSFLLCMCVPVCHMCVICVSYHITRVGPIRMTVYTPYPRYAVYPVPYLRFLTVYDRIWTVFAGGTPQTRVRFLAKAVFCSFWSNFFFSRLFKLSIPLTSYTYMHAFALNTLYNVWLW